MQKEPEMGRRSLAFLTAFVFLMQAGWAFAASPSDASRNTTTTNAFAVNKTDKNTYLVLDQKGSDPFQAVKYIPKGVAGHVSAYPRAWFRASTSYEYTARLFSENEQTPFCTVEFRVANIFDPSPRVQGIAILNIQGTCKASAAINEHNRQTSCQVSITAN
jgi:hypothetical protein